MLLDTLAANVFLPAWDRLRGSRAARYQAEVRKVLDASAEQVREFQWERIRQICQHAHETTEFYRQRFDELEMHSFDRLSPEEFRRIPALTKIDVREQVSAMLSKRHHVTELRKSETSGTTSSPTSVYLDWPSNDRRWAATYEWDRRIGYARGHKIAYLWGARQDYAMSPSWKSRVLNSVVTRNKFLASGPLDDKILGDYYEMLHDWKPSYLQAYPTALAILAEFLLRNRLSLRIPRVSVTAEPLLPSQAAVITEAFGHRPFNWYGAREAGRIATECQYHAGMHVNAYGVYVEIDSQGEYGDGGLGRILITDLWNEAMPMIRYEIGDIGTMTDEPCTCRSALPRIIALEGRAADVFSNSTGQRIPGLIFTNRIDDSQVREMQLVQTAIRRFDVLVVPGPNWQGEVTVNDISASLIELMQENTEANVKIVDCIPREASGKVRYCKSLLKC